MKQQMIVKAMDIEQGDLEKINRYTRRPLTIDEVYIFQIVLCDNDVDRDYDCFTVGALKALSELFLGTTGIFDHNPKGENQTARIFETEVVTCAGKETQCGEPYTCLRAKAYMVRTNKNADLILEIDAGIKKEVSVGCSVETKQCSVCGADLKHTLCEHTKGVQYGDKLCYTILDHPDDAYEWSFVAVPAQRNAGVTKKFHGNGRSGHTMKECESGKELMKSLGGKNASQSFSAEECRALYSYVEGLEEQALLGKAYLEEMQEKVVRMAFLCGDGVDAGIVQAVVKKMNLQELRAYEKSYETRLSGGVSEQVQLADQADLASGQPNRAFKI